MGAAMDMKKYLAPTSMTTKGSWLWKLGFRSERQHPKECEEDRTALQKELLDWVGRSWASEEQGEQN